MEAGRALSTSKRRVARWRGRARPTPVPAHTSRRSPRAWACASRSKHCHLDRNPFAPISSKVESAGLPVRDSRLSTVDRLGASRALSVDPDVVDEIQVREQAEVDALLTSPRAANRQV